MIMVLLDHSFGQRATIDYAILPHMRFYRLAVIIPLNILHLENVVSQPTVEALKNVEPGDGSLPPSQATPAHDE